jgi:hypothetical protein
VTEGTDKSQKRKTRTGTRGTQAQGWKEEVQTEIKKKTKKSKTRRKKKWTEEYGIKRGRRN